MTVADYDLLHRHLEAFALKRGLEIEKPATPISHVYFPESGLLSLIATADGRQIEVGLIGPEGMSGTAVLLGKGRSLLRTCVQAPGDSFRIPSFALQDAIKASATLRELLTAHALTLMTQLAYTALASGTAKIEVRVARWLLMAQDRTSGEMKLTHEVIADALGVRRSGITVVLNSFSARALITMHRGRLRITDPGGLKRLAGNLYGAPEAEYGALTAFLSPHVISSAPTNLPPIKLTVDVNAVLRGRRVLIVEDDHYVALELVRDLTRRGAAVVGPVASLENALAAAENEDGIDLAVLDINLRGKLVYPVVDTLKAKGVAVVFATCYDPSAIPARYFDLPRCEKPLNATDVAGAIAQSLAWPAS